MALPTVQKLTHNPVLVLPTDDAWDTAAYDEYIKDNEKGDPALRQYFSGDSRYDLDTVKHFLDPEKTPIKFHFRRLTFREHTKSIAAYSTGERECWVYCLRALEAVTGLEGFKFGETSMSESKMEELADLIGTIPLCTVGRAIFVASARIGSMEKKV